MVGGMQATIADFSDREPEQTPQKYRWKGESAINRDHGQFQEHACISWNKGYRHWVSKDPDGQQRYLTVHRLAAVAEYGFDAVARSAVHHANGIRWLNVPRFTTDIPELENPNLAPMDVVSHSKLLGSGPP